MDLLRSGIKIAKLLIMSVTFADFGIESQVNWPKVVPELTRTP